MTNQAAKHPFKPCRSRVPPPRKRGPRELIREALEVQGTDAPPVVVALKYQDPTPAEVEAFAAKMAEAEASGAVVVVVERYGRAGDAARAEQAALLQKAPPMPPEPSTAPTASNPPTDSPPADCAPPRPIVEAEAQAAGDGEAFVPWHVCHFIPPAGQCGVPGCTVRSPTVLAQEAERELVERVEQEHLTALRVEVTAELLKVGPDA